MFLHDMPLSAQCNIQLQLYKGLYRHKQKHLHTETEALRSVNFLNSLLFPNVWVWHVQAAG